MHARNVVKLAEKQKEKKKIVEMGANSPYLSLHKLLAK